MAAASLESSSRRRRSGRFSASSLRDEGFAAGGRTFDDLLDQAVLERFGSTDRITADDHLDREFRPDRARQALGAAGARQQAELHLGQAELGFLHGHAEMTGQRDLEAAAERGAVDRGDDRLGRVLDLGEHVVEAGRLRRLAEFGDVGAGDEGAAGAGQDDALDRGIGDRGLDAFQNTAAHCGTQRIDRRTVDRDDPDFVMTLKLDHFAHGFPPWWGFTFVRFRGAEFNSAS